MKKILVVGSIGGVILLVLSSSTSVVGYQTIKDTYLSKNDSNRLMSKKMSIIQKTIRGNTSWFPGYYSILAIIELLLRISVRFHEFNGTEPGNFFLILVIVGVIIYAIGQNGLQWVINEIVNIFMRIYYELSRAGPSM